MTQWGAIDLPYVLVLNATRRSAILAAARVRPCLAPWTCASREAFGAEKARIRAVFPWRLPLTSAWKRGGNLVSHDPSFPVTEAPSLARRTAQGG